MPAFLNRLLAIADEPTDDDDERLRKRFGVTGYISVVARRPLQPIRRAGGQLWRREDQDHRRLLYGGRRRTEPRADHAQSAMELARGMLRALADARSRLGLALELRVGLASGSVVGGVIGQKRILFDLWGTP
ncbi:MAG: hypothetical protein M3R49_01750 [Chloroflexota bacterium]|nr:hypothetical protein [Chloroflexota bacterium]